MTDVACFCGCLYSFDSGGGACPDCGEYAAVTVADARLGTERAQQQSRPVSASADPDLHNGSTRAG
jgi:hypothetical protein